MYIIYDIDIIPIICSLTECSKNKGQNLTSTSRHSLPWQPSVLWEGSMEKTNRILAKKMKLFGEGPMQKTNETLEKFNSLLGKWRPTSWWRACEPKRRLYRSATNRDPRWSAVTEEFIFCEDFLVCVSARFTCCVWCCPIFRQLSRLQAVTPIPALSEFLFGKSSSAAFLAYWCKMAQV